VNLLLVAADEVDATGLCTLVDERAVHLRTVVKAQPGSSVRAGIVGGGLGIAQVVTDDGTALVLRLALGTPPPPMPVELVLAIPRPKVIARVVEIAASFAITRLDLTNAWRVEKSYLGSPRLAPDALTAAALRGASQGATTHLPVLAVHRRLMDLVDARFPGDGVQIDKQREPQVVNLDIVPSVRLIAHPGAPMIETVVTTPGPIALAIGPEGGWIERELETFVARGFRPVSLGAPILRVEAAVAAALAQLMLLARLTR
jgi:RsmE family RNA methyltransferase